MASHPASVHTQPRASESIAGAFWMFAAIAIGFTAASWASSRFSCGWTRGDARDRDSCRRHCARPRSGARGRHRRSRAHDCSGSRELRRRRPGERRGARGRAQALSGRDARSAGRRVGQVRPGPDGSNRRSRPWSQILRLGMGRRRAWARAARSGGADGPDHPHEQGGDPALDRLPRCPDRAERRVQGCHAR